MAMKKATGKQGSKAEVFKFETKGQELKGTLTEKGKLTYDDKEINRYVVETAKGPFSTLGSYKLDELLDEVPVGAKVEITYTGKERLAGGKTLKGFEVAYDDSAIAPRAG